ncbi:hypothetical protein ACH5RR_037391 [Cinchona calisaya]|uniref:Uncharacterized protein n=1 Tax=Cinchona calisaya TaxID=153742 RepID=A0ABD2Y944_9GENT
MAEDMTKILQKFSPSDVELGGAEMLFDDDYQKGNKREVKRQSVRGHPKGEKQGKLEEVQQKESQNR